MKNGLILSLGVITGLVTAFDGGMILANQMVGDKQYSEAEFQEYGEQQREEGYNEGLTVNVGYSEEDLQNAYNEGLNSGISQSEEAITNLNEIIDLLAGGVRVNATYGNIEFVSSFNESVEGLWIHNTETGEYKKIISNGYNFNPMENYNDNSLILISGYWNSTTQGGYVYNLETGQIVMFSETGQWEMCPFSDGNADFFIVPLSGTDNELKGEGIYYFHSDEMRAEQIMSTGKNWYQVGVYENKENHLLYYFSSHSSDELGLYAYDTTSMELITVASEGCNYQYFQSLGDKQVIACSLGLVEINDDGTINVLIANETGQIDVIYDVHPNNIVVDFSNVYRYNIESETFKQIDFGVSSVTDMQFEVGVYYILNNEESKFVIYSVSEDEVFTVNLEENMIFQGDVIDYNFGDEGNYITLYGLPSGESGMFKTYHIDIDAGTIEEVVE